MTKLGERWGNEGDRPIYFGEFLVLGALGRGGMATVVRARSPRGRGLPPLVALKFLHQELAGDPEVMEAFAHEAFMGMRCVHPSLCRTFSVEVIGGRSALVMELLLGHSLTEFLAQLKHRSSTPDNQLAAAIIVSRIARALHVVHEARDDHGRPVGAVHRDVTPQNIVVTDEGETKLIDFGVAFSSESAARTAEGVVKGKLSYLSPEYLAGKSWDRRLDVWSLGVICWELLTGLRLFRADTMARRLAMVTNMPIPSLRQSRPAIDPELERIVLSCLERDPERRYDSAASLADDLEHFVRLHLEVHPSTHLVRWLRSFPTGPMSGVVPVENPSFSLQAGEQDLEVTR